MKKHKKLLGVILSSVLAISITANCMIAAYASTGGSGFDANEKINDELNSILSSISSDEKIPVYLWYRDVNQDSIDEQTKKETGYGNNDLSVSSSTINYNLTNANELNQYIEDTASVRKIEKQRTDSYIETRRSISEVQYNNKANDLLSQLSISDEDIVFKSLYAPTIIANLTKEEIAAAENNSLVLDIGYYEEPEIELCTKESINANSGYNKLVSKYNLTGAGVKVGMIEIGYPEPDDEIDLSQIKKIGNIGIHGHATNTAKILEGTENGFAKGIDLYSTDTKFENIELMLSEGVQVINISVSWKITENDTSENYVESYYDKWFNHIVSFHNVTVVACAGNSGTGDANYRRVSSPAAAHNVIAVGAYHDLNTDTIDDDVLYDYSSYKNNNGKAHGLEKPDVVVSANIGGNGTSSSTPVLTSMIALMFELKPSLAAYPQAVKSIVLASCHHKVIQSEELGGQELMEDGITERQGAGVPDAFIMANIICRGTYGIGTISGNSKETIKKFKQLPYGSSNINTSISWLKESNEDSNGTITYGDYIDLDLSLSRDGQVIGKSELEHSSTEMIYVPLGGQGNYELSIKKYFTSDTTVRYGFAYSTDKHYADGMTQEGIYCLKDYNNNYLTLDTSTNKLKLSPFTGDSTQQWIFNNLNSRYGGYDVSPGYGNVVGGIGRGASINGSIISEAAITDQKVSLNIFDFESTGRQDGLVYLQSRLSGPALIPSNSSVRLEMMSGPVGERKVSELWSLERVDYRKGDVNMDGDLNISDVTMIQKIIVELVTADNIQNYLADYNRNGEVEVSDATELQKMISHIT